jgi:hypothetical protein
MPPKAITAWSQFLEPSTTCMKSVALFSLDECELISPFHVQIRKYPSIFVAITHQGVVSA